jgi:hypothetical protein
LRRKVASLSAIDRQRRPLFAAFAADAILAGRDIRQWDQGELLGSVLKGEKDRHWKPAGVTEEEKNLLALATMTGGLRVGILKNPPVKDFLPPPRDYSPDRYRIMSGRPGKRFLSPLEPSVLGEFFVLDHLEPESDVDDRAEIARSAAFRIDKAKHDQAKDDAGEAGEDLVGERGPGFQYFFERAARNFPGHPTLKHLRAKRPEKMEPHFNWGINAANLIESLKEDANLELCREIYQDLYNVAFEQGRTQVAVLRHRAAHTALKLLYRFANRGDLPGARRFYEDLHSMAAADHVPVSGFEKLRKDEQNEYLRLQVLGRATLALVYANRNELLAADKLYEEIRSIARENASISSMRHAEALVAATITDVNVKLGNFQTARARYEQLRALADEYGTENDLRLRQLHAMSSLIEGYSNAGDMQSARLLYHDLRTMAAAQASLAQSTAEPHTSEQRPSVGAIFTGLVLGMLNLGLQTIGGEDFNLLPRQSEPDFTAVLCERQAYAAYTMVCGYRDTKNTDGAVQMYEELCTVVSKRRDKRLTYYQGRGAWCLFGAYLNDGKLSLARSMYDELSNLAEVHGAEVVPVRVRVAAAYQLIYTYESAGAVSSAKDFARASAQSLQREEARVALTDLYGPERAEAFYVLLEHLLRD